MSIQTEQGFSIHADTMIGSLELVVADLDRSVRFYRDILGFEVQSRDGQTASLGVDGQLLLRLAERPGARPHPVRTTGLYHFRNPGPKVVAIWRARSGAWQKLAIRSRAPPITW